MNLLKFCGVAALTIIFFSAMAMAQTVDIYGQVRIYDGNPSVGVGVNGVTVMLYDEAQTVLYTDVSHYDYDFMVAHELTSPDGIYYFDDVPYRLDYWVEIIIPEGYVRATNPQQGSWWNANPRECGDDFYNCFLLLPNNPHTIGYWKHQAKVATTGKGNAQVPADELQGLLDATFSQFDGAIYFPVENVSSVGGVALTPDDMMTTFTLPNGGSTGMVNKAKKQLLALLLMS